MLEELRSKIAEYEHCSDFYYREWTLKMPELAAMLDEIIELRRIVNCMTGRKVVEK